MDTQKMSATKLCSFYVSDWHLITMLLPYINKKIDEKNNIATILEKDITNDINELLNKVNLKNKEKILNINWKNKEKINIKEIINDKKNTVLIINGSNEYIDKAIGEIESYIYDNGIKSQIKIISCYELSQLKGDINSILDKNDKILNTSGERQIEEIFENYNKPKLKIV